MRSRHDVRASAHTHTCSGLKLSDMNAVEINEAFAAQYLACEKDLGLDRSITNVSVSVWSVACSGLAGACSACYGETNACEERSTSVFRCFSEVM
jgi:acetyl-CoA acetyltransferase